MREIRKSFFRMEVFRNRQKGCLSDRSAQPSRRRAWPGYAPGAGWRGGCGRPRKGIRPTPRSICRLSWAMMCRPSVSQPPRPLGMRGRGVDGPTRHARVLWMSFSYLTMGFCPYDSIGRRQCQAGNPTGIDGFFCRTCGLKNPALQARGRNFPQFTKTLHSSFLTVPLEDGL